MVELATALGRDADAANYTAYRAALVGQFNAAWLSNATAGAFGLTQGQLQSSTGAAIMVGAAAAAGVEAAAGAALAADLARLGGHINSGILGLRSLHQALTATGSGAAAVDSLLGTSYPSYGYMFTNTLEPSTTLWELMDAPAEGPTMNSRNHHMWSPPAGWLVEDLAGLSQTRSLTPQFRAGDAGQVGFRHAVFFPRVAAPAHPAVQWAQGSLDTAAGRYVFSWATANASRGAGATCVAGVGEGGSAAFACPAGLSVGSVSFASFGTPTGSCTEGFARGSCDSLNSTAVTAAACVGKARCSVPVSSAAFGGDPCVGTSKQYSAVLSCTPPAPGSVPGLSLGLSVPANARATVRVPFPANASAASLSVAEGGVAVFRGGAFVPGVAGVVAAAMTEANDVPPGQKTVDIEVLAGDYAFESFT
jgi:hypothetical protein